MDAKSDIVGNHLEEIHSTPMGIVRIQRNLALPGVDVVAWCKARIADPRAEITRTGKNWYVRVDGVVITINAHSYTIITAHPGRLG